MVPDPKSETGVVWVAEVTKNQHSKATIDVVDTHIQPLLKMMAAFNPTMQQQLVPIIQFSAS